MIAGRRVAGSVLGIAAAVVTLLLTFPRATGAGWDATADQFGGIAVWQILVMIVIWAAGLWTHTFVLRAALPGLSRRHAFALNLGGSGVSNVLPFGGAAGLGLNYAMLRSWGYDRMQITAFATVSNLVVAIVKACVAVLGLFALLSIPGIAGAVRGLHLPEWPLFALAAIGFVLAVSALFARRQLVAAAHQVRAYAQGLFRYSTDVVRGGWQMIAFGGIGYPALQVVLFSMCLTVVHTGVSVAAMLVTFAVVQMLTMVPITPGGVGVVETIAAGLLIAFGASGASAAAGVVLFRIFSYLIEIPLGAVVAGTWLATRPRSLTTRQ